MVIDTLRADHLGCYGYFRNTSPTLDKLSREGILFEDFYAAGIPTGPGFTSLVTGLYPINHQYYITPWNIPNAYQLDDEIPVLADIMQTNGYTTVAVDNLMNFRSHMKHMVRGFEYYINVTRTPLHIPHHITADQINKRLFPWLRGHSEEKFFLFIHYWDPHLPYNHPPESRNRFSHKKGDLSDLEVKQAEAGYEYVTGWGVVGKLFEGSQIHRDRSIDRYDEEILYVDHAIENLLKLLRNEGILENTLMVITSDHGEGLGQHAIYGHAGLHESIIKVPLILWCPSLLPKGVRIKGYTQHVDVFPTILDIVGLRDPMFFGKPVETDGSSLNYLSENDKSPRDFAVAEAWGERAIIEGEWKLITHTIEEMRLRRDTEKFTTLKGNIGLELYNIREDPMENINQTAQNDNIAKKLEDKLDFWVRKQLAGRIDPMSIPDNERIDILYRKKFEISADLM